MNIYFMSILKLNFIELIVTYINELLFLDNTKNPFLLTQNAGISSIIMLANFLIEFFLFSKNCLNIFLQTFSSS